MSTITADVEEYATRVRSELADLPAADRDDLLADLEAHLAEVAGEDPDAPLEALLGAPEAYAAELRSSAGLPPAEATAGPPTDGRRRALAGQAWLRSTREFLPELRPGWWVLRGLLLAALPSALFGFGVFYLVVLSVVLVPASVLIGRRAAVDPALRWTGIALGIVAVLALLLVLGTGTAVRSGSGGGEVYPAGSDPLYSTGSGLDGVTNIHPYSKDGTPLGDVLLYDQDGNPIVLPGGSDREGRPVTVVPRYDREGRVVDNLFPQEQTVEDAAVELGPDAVVAPRQRKVAPPSVVPPTLRPR